MAPSCSQRLGAARGCTSLVCACPSHHGLGVPNQSWAHPVAPSALSPAARTHSGVPQPRVGPGAVPPPAALAPMPRNAVTLSSCSRFGHTRCRKGEVSTLGALFLGRNSRLNADKSQQGGCREGVRGRGKEAVPCSSSPLCPAQPQPAPFGALHPPPAPPAPGHGDGGSIHHTKRSRSPAEGHKPRSCAGLVGSCKTREVP